MSLNLQHFTLLTKTFLNFLAKNGKVNPMLIFGELPSSLGVSLNSSHFDLLSSSMDTPLESTALLVWTSAVTVSYKHTLDPLKGKKSWRGIAHTVCASSNITSRYFIFAITPQQLMMCAVNSILI